MKKKILILLGVLMLSLVGCASPSENEAEQEMEEIQEEDSREEEEDQAEEPTSLREDTDTDSETDNSMEQNSVENVSEGDNSEQTDTLTEALPSIQELTKYFSTWAGIHMGEYVAESAFDDYLKGDLIAFAVSTGWMEQYPGVPWEQDMAYKYITPEEVQELSQLFFGTELDTTCLPRILVLEEARFAADANGGIIVAVGDWGLEAPEGEAYFSLEDDGTIIAEYIYDMWEYDFMLSDNCYVERRAYSQIGTVTYTCEPSEESPLGYIISDVSLNPEIVYYGVPEQWEGNSTVYDSPLGYQMEIPEALNGRISYFSDNGIDIFISTACEEENYGGVLFMITVDKQYFDSEDAVYEFVTPEGNVFFAAYPDRQQYDADNPEKEKEYKNILKYMIAMIYTATY